MNPGMLTEIAELFQAAAQNWPNVLIAPMEATVGIFILLAMVLMAMSLLFHSDVLGISEHLLSFLLTAGASMFFIRHGHEFAASLFRGIEQIGVIMGLPAVMDPSAIANMGNFVSASMWTALANQGFLSFATSPTMWVFALSALIVTASWWVLSLVVLCQLLLSFTLIAAAPFFAIWFILPFTRSLAEGYIKLLFGTAAALFFTEMVAAIATEAGALMEEQLRAQFLAPGVTLGLSDYLLPLAVSVVLAGCYIWLPLSIARSVGSWVPDWSGGRYLGGMAGAAVSGTWSTTMRVVGGGQGGNRDQVENNSSGMGNSGGQQQRQPAERSGWGKR